ncbi:MAG TPA: hypothetical protein DEP66_03030 [Acidimicrobiaceae bacterium]|nr:hypothetical protein [Acidimicrobiaceae bacterium]HCB37193.1 hypothetical protein [Acidimicrobiaceae bacterium]
MAKGTMERTAAGSGLSADLAAEAVAWRRMAGARGDSRDERRRLLECVSRAFRKADVAADDLPASKWLPRVLRLLEVLGEPASSEEAADPEQDPTLSVDVGARSIETLFRFLARVPTMPDPRISPDGAGGLDISWVSSDLKLKVGFAVEPGTTSMYAWGRFRDAAEPWSGTVDDSEEEIERALRLLSAD